MAKATIDRDEIQKWVEARGGFPAHVKRTGDSKDPGVLRIDYPGYSGTGSLERISWDEFFDAFDSSNLAFLYQPTGRSRFSKLIDRDSADIQRPLLARVKSKITGRGESTKKSASKKSAASKKSSSKKSSSKKSSSKKASSSKKSSSKKSSSRKSSKKK